MNLVLYHVAGEVIDQSHPPVDLAQEERSSIGAQPLITCPGLDAAVECALEERSCFLTQDMAPVSSSVRPSPTDRMRGTGTVMPLGAFGDEWYGFKSTLPFR